MMVRVRRGTHVPTTARGAASVDSPRCLRYRSPAAAPPPPCPPCSCSCCCTSSCMSSPSPASSASSGTSTSSAAAGTADAVLIASTHCWCPASSASSTGVRSCLARRGGVGWGQGRDCQCLRGRVRLCTVRTACSVRIHAPPPAPLAHLLSALALAPAATSSRTTSTRPFRHAQCSGVLPSSLAAPGVCVWQRQQQVRRSVRRLTAATPKVHPATHSPPPWPAAAPPCWRGRWLPPCAALRWSSRQRCEREHARGCLASPAALAAAASARAPSPARAPACVMHAPPRPSPPHRSCQTRRARSRRPPAPPRPPPPRRPQTARRLSGRQPPRRVVLQGLPWCAWPRGRRAGWRPRCGAGAGKGACARASSSSSTSEKRVGARRGRPASETKQQWGELRCWARAARSAVRGQCHTRESAKRGTHKASAQGPGRERRHCAPTLTSSCPSAA